MPDAKPQQSKLLKHSTIYAVGNISRQLVGFLMLPIYTRYLTPADYGVIGLLTFAVTLLEGAFGARLTQAMPKYYYQQDNERDRNAVISTALIITALISLATSTLIFFLQSPGSSLLFGTDTFALAIGLYGFQLVLSAVEGYGLTFIRILQRPFVFIAFSFAKLVVQLSLNIWFVVHLEMGVMGVVYSSVSASLLFALIVGVYTLRKTGITCRWDIGRQMLLFSWPLWLSGMAIFYVSASGRYYIRLFSTLADVGLFELASKFSSILILIFWQPFTQIWDTERFRIHKESPQSPAHAEAFANITAIMSVGMLGISAFSPAVINIMASEQFHAASAAVPLLTIGATFASLGSFFNFSFLATNKTGWITRNNFVIAVVATAMYALLVPIMGHVGAAAALCGTQIIQFFWCYFASARVLNVGVPLGKNLLVLASASLLSVLLGREQWTSNIFIDIAIRSATTLIAISAIALISASLRNMFGATIGRVSKRAN